MKPFLKKIMYLLCLTFLIGCNRNIKKTDTIYNKEVLDTLIYVNEFPNRDVLLTSHLDTETLLLYIPFEIEIKRQKNEEIFGITSYIYSNVEGGTPSQIPFQNINTFKPLQSDYFKENPSLNKVIQYRVIKFYPKRDTIVKSLIKELNFIKENCIKSNKYFNDTIRYKNIKEFEAKYQKIYNKTYEHKELKVDLIIKKDTILKPFTKIYTFKY